MTEFAEWNVAEAEPIAARWKDVPGGLLPMLIEFQQTFGYINDEAIPIAADAMNLSKAEVVGVANFYHDFRKSPSAPHTLKVCLAEACQAAGGNDLVAHLAERLGAAPGERSADGEVDVDAVYCLGNCALSPAVMLDGMPYGRVTPQRADALLGRLA